MTKPISNGKIVTFYSFKGGVGRTMAVANVAYLLAMNGYRTLVMDWDLEAPGLAYYFRGLQNPVDARELRDAPGVLNILWDWRIAYATGDKEQLEKKISEFDAGAPFQHSVRPLLVDEELPDSACLDYIGAGCKAVETPGITSYEDALAAFSWTNFLNEEFGGFVINSLRKWAKANYDFVLIDSRTGLADVAGICTMQIPDLVLVCFILNRQNIDGAARVAGAVRVRRSEQVKVRAMPMRVQREGTAEETDARAKAMAEFRRIAGFSVEAISEDFKQLAVVADQTPFYETLAPFSASNLSFDRLTLNYLQVATELTKTLDNPRSKTLAVPEFDNGYLETVRRRLEPRNATVEYISDLKVAEPARARSELQRLIDGAYQTELDTGGLENEYILALVEAITTIEDNDEPIEVISMLEQVLDILRLKYTQNRQQWAALLLKALEKYLEDFSFLNDPNEDLVLLEEIDEVLHEVPTVPNRLKRVAYRRRAAQVYLASGDHESAMQIIGEIVTQLLDFEKQGLSADQMAELLFARAEVFILRGDVAQERAELPAALSHYRDAADILEGVDLDGRPSRAELYRIRFEVYSRLARLPVELVGHKDIAGYASQAARSANGSSAFVPVFVPLARAALHAAHDAEVILGFCESTFVNAHAAPLISLLSNFYGRQARMTVAILNVLSDLTKAIAPCAKENQVRVATVLSLLSQVALGVTRNLMRRRKTIGGKAELEIAEASDRLGEEMEKMGLDLSKLGELY